MLATSREPIGVAGEVSWRVPSLSLTDEAIELFTDRARHARPEFAVTDDNVATVGEICTRLDGLPLAIELAAARVRALSLTEILDSLHDRFRLLTGGARTAVRRQQTLRASVDWSHALLSEARTGTFSPAGRVPGRLRPRRRPSGSRRRRHAAIPGDRPAHSPGGQVAGGRRRDTAGEPATGCWRPSVSTRPEKLGESGEADDVRTRHRDHYTSMAALLDGPAGSDYEQRVEQTETEIDNMRAAFAWSRENGDAERALALASSLSAVVAAATRGGCCVARHRP